VKGNHYHLHKTEWYCVIKGRMRLVLKDMDSGKVSEITLGDDKLRIVKIPPRVIHGFKNTGEGDMYLVYCTDTPFDPQDPDTFAEVALE
ncbi:MAG TPA: polysaccharide biosynthesis C-terminal domain-containing protein, partial [Candidatus Tripitaka californicus]